MSGPITYTCNHCGGTFDAGWSDDEAQQEALDNWGQRGDAPDMAVVCDDCYNAFMRWIDHHEQETH